MPEVRHRILNEAGQSAPARRVDAVCLMRSRARLTACRSLSSRRSKCFKAVLRSRAFNRCGLGLAKAARNSVAVLVRETVVGTRHPLAMSKIALRSSDVASILSMAVMR